MWDEEFLEDLEIEILDRDLRNAEEHHSNDQVIAGWIIFWLCVAIFCLGNLLFSKDIYFERPVTRSSTTYQVPMPKFPTPTRMERKAWEEHLDKQWEREQALKVQREQQWKLIRQQFDSLNKLQ